MTSSASLQRAGGPRPLGVAAQQLFAAALDGKLHVVAHDPGGRVRHVAVDAQGHAAVLADLPLAASTGVVGCAGALVVAGWTAASAPVIVRVAGDGAVGAAQAVPATPPLHVWPRPLCVGDAPWLIWTAGDPAAVHVGAAGAAAGALALPDDTDQLDAVGDDRGLWLARVHGADRRLALVRIEHGAVIDERDAGAAQAGTPSLARLGKGVALAWIEGARVHVRAFDAGVPDHAATLDTAPEDGPLDGARLVGAADGALALLVWSQVAGDAATEHRTDGTAVHAEPRHTSHLRVVPYDGRAQRFGPPLVIEPDQQVHAAAWLDGALLVVHAGPDAAAQLSLFRP